MAENVMAQVVGGKKQIVEDCDTVGDVRKALGIGANYAGAINGEAAADDTELEEGNFVSFSEQVKGAI